jgi:MFS family permease
MGGEWSLGVALVMELWPSASRPILAGLIGAAANVGFLAIALIGLGLAHVREGLREALLALDLSEGSVRYLMGADGSGWRILLFLGGARRLTYLSASFARISAPRRPPKRRRRGRVLIGGSGRYSPRHGLSAVSGREIGQ